LHELESGIRCIDNYAARGRKRAEEHLPNLLKDIQEIVDGQSQTDPSFESTRLYTRLSAAAVRQALITQKGYADEELPSQETIRVKLNELDYTLRSVKKSVPQKIEETDAIFEQLGQTHAQARQDITILRLSLDAKAAVNIGPFSRRGKTRVHLCATDHDF